jgi:hypothetical protein
VAQKSKLGEASAFWKYGSRIHDDPWIDAIAAIDYNGDNAPLIEMLLSDTPLDAANRSHLANLLRRKKFKDRGGQPETPSYARSFAAEVLEEAVAAVRDLIKAGVDKDEALERISKSRCIDEDMLGEACDGRLGSFNRARKRGKK